MKTWSRALYLIALTLSMNQITHAHGYFNMARFFPSAITVDEPFISDKLVLNVYRTESPADNGGDTWTTNPKLIYAKTITQYFQASATASYLHIKNPRQRAQNGFDDWTIGVRYNVFKCPHTETIFSVALNSTIGGTGSEVVDAASTTTLAPEVLLGQGLAFIPKSLRYLKPIAFIIALSPEIITTNYTVTSVNWAAAIEYSLPMMQEFITHFNSPLLDHMVPIVELPFNTCTQGTCSGKTTGNIDPGVILFNKYGQMAAEAVIPVNNNTGNKIGGVVQFYLYLDTIFPDSLGKPIF